MTQACCHFLYPIVLNPWCTSLFRAPDTFADLYSAALPILDIYHTDSDSQTILCIMYISAPFHTSGAKPPRCLRLPFGRDLINVHSTLLHPPTQMATAPPQAPPGHAHPHPHPPQPGQPGIRPPPGMMMGPSPPPNPALQAILDAIPHINVPFSIQEGTIPNTNPPQTTTMVTCDAHKQVICKICDIHFGPINYMFNFLKGAPAEAIPPPPNAPTQPQRAEAIKQAKEAGNVCHMYASDQRS